MRVKYSRGDPLVSRINEPDYTKMLGPEVTTFDKRIEELTLSENIVRTIILLRLSEGRTTYIRDLTPITQVIGGNLLAIMKRLSQQI